MKKGWFVKGIDRNFCPILKPEHFESGPHDYRNALRVFDNMRFGVGATQLQLIQKDVTPLPATSSKE